MKKFLLLGAAAMLACAANAQSLTKVWEKDLPNHSNAIARMCTLVDGKVIIPNVSEQKIYAHDANGETVLADLNEFMKANYSYEAEEEKVNKDENGDTISVEKVTVTKVHTFGHGLVSDDAGNLLVGFTTGSAKSATDFIRVSKDGSKIELAPVTLPEGVTAARTDQLGRVAGDLFGEDGAYFFITPNGTSNAVLVDFYQGAGEGKASPQLTWAASTSVIAVPSMTYDEIYNSSNPEAAFYARHRGQSTILKGQVTDGVAEVVATAVTNNSGGNEGFDVFTIEGKQYAVQSVKSATGNARSLSFAVYDLETGDELARVNNETSADQWASYSARVSEDGKTAQIAAYWANGKKCGLYEFNPTGSSAIEEIAADNAPVEYYNLQGVKVANPENGIFVKKQGTKATKVVL